MTYHRVSSSNNDTVKFLRKLTSQQKFRRETQQTVAHGPHLIESYRNWIQEAEMFYVASSAIDNPEVTALVRILESHQIKGVELPDSLYESLSDVHARVGISLVIPVPAADTARPLEEDAILLEAVQDPGNLGTILRTARATGIHKVYLSADCTSAWGPKALRAGMGAQFGLTIYEQADLRSIIKQSRIPVYATTLSPDSISLYDIPLHSEVAWLFGSEGRGVSVELQNLAHQRVHIPQVTSSVESLNIAAAAAVCLYERFRHKQ